MSDENFFSRWSRRKVESKAGTAGPTADSTPAKPAPVVLEPGAGAPSRATEAPAETAEPPEALPPIESLTSESDFTPFMKAEVDPGLKRQAFKKLIEDPRYNIMDGLDVYIDDYSKPDPLPEGWLEKMNQVKHLGIFKPAEEEAVAETPAEVAAEAPPLQNTIPEQPLAEVEAEVPVDTSAAQVPPSRVGKPGVRGEGL